MRELTDRLAPIDDVLDDPPVVHSLGVTEGPRAPKGVWRTELSCYRFLAEVCAPGARTLETGLGVSTVLFALWGCRHTCVVQNPVERDRLIAYLADRGIADTGLRITVGLSQYILPTLDPSPLDVVFIDGGHGFPVPLIDWFYTASRLVRGGVLVVDDLHVPSVRLGLLDFLTADPRWKSLTRTDKWGAWRRESSGDLEEEWDAQVFLGRPGE